MQRAWIVLFVAGLLEIAWAIGLKYSDGLKKPLVSAVTVVAMIASFVVLAQALKKLPVGTGYAVWTGIGVIGTTVLGIVLFDEPRNAMRIASILLIIIGIAGLRLTTT